MVIGVVFKKVIDYLINNCNLQVFCFRPFVKNHFSSVTLVSGAVELDPGQFKFFPIDEVVPAVCSFLAWLFRESASRAPMDLLLSVAGQQAGICVPREWHSWQSR